MTDDLERRVRTALHERAAALTPQRTERRGTQPTVRGWAAPLLAAAAVVVLAIAVAVAVGIRPGSGSDTGAPAAGGAAYAGYQWRVISLQDRNGPLDVPPDIDATVAFASDGSVYADDTVNRLTARYDTGEAAYTVENASSTYAVYGGGDPDRERVISAVDALFFTVSGAVPDDGSGSSPRLTIVARTQGDTLTLQTAATEIITVTLERQGSVPGPVTQMPSSTSGAPSDAPSDLPASESGSYAPNESVPASP